MAATSGFSTFGFFTFAFALCGGLACLLPSSLLLPRQHAMPAPLPTGAARAVLGGLPFSFSGSVRLVAGLVLGHRGHALVLVSSLVCQDSHGVQRGGA